jgi:hypothetical protein
MRFTIGYRGWSCHSMTPGSAGVKTDPGIRAPKPEADEALAYAQEHQGVVYMYDVTEHGNLLNETIMYIEEPPA